MVLYDHCTKPHPTALEQIPRTLDPVAFFSESLFATISSTPALTGRKHAHDARHQFLPVSLPLMPFRAPAKRGYVEQAPIYELLWV